MFPVTAQEALGHSSVDTTAKHYAKRIDVTALMRREMGAWLGEGLKNSIIVV